MEVEVIYRRPDRTPTSLGMRKLTHRPPIGEPFAADSRQYVAASCLGSDEEGRYQLFLEDGPNAPLH